MESNVSFKLGNNVSHFAQGKMLRSWLFQANYTLRKLVKFYLNDSINVTLCKGPIDYPYSNYFISTSDGVVLAEFWMVFETEAVLPITPLNLAVKRGRLRNLAIEMGDYQVTQVVGMFEGLSVRKSGQRWARKGFN